MNRNPSIFNAGLRVKTEFGKGKGPAEMKLIIGGGPGAWGLPREGPREFVFVLGLSPNPRSRSIWFH
jgi:hypothetical protein